MRSGDFGNEGTLERKRDIPPAEPASLRAERKIGVELAGGRLAPPMALRPTRNGKRPCERQSGDQGA